MANNNSNPLASRSQPGGVIAIVDEAVFTGSIFFVDSSNSAATDSTGFGFSKDAPFATLAYAISQCSAGKGDYIFACPGHAENVANATAFALNISGVTIVGLGSGELRPKVSFITSTVATIALSAANVTLKNVVFVNGIDALGAMLTISGKDAKLLGVEMRDNNASFACTNAIVTTAAADRLQVMDHVHRANGGKTGAASAIRIVGGNDIVVVPRFIDGDFSVSCINNVTTACDSLQVFGSGAGNYMRNRNASCVIVTCVATTKGRIGPNLNARLATNAANITEAFVGAAMEFFQPINIVNADGESSMQTNITASTDA